MWQYKDGGRCLFSTNVEALTSAVATMAESLSVNLRGYGIWGRTPRNIKVNAVLMYSYLVFLEVVKHVGQSFWRQPCLGSKTATKYDERRASYIAA